MNMTQHNVRYTHHKDRHIVHVPRLQDLLADVLDVLEAVLAGDVVDEDVGGGVAEAVAAEVCPLVERADRKVRDVGAVDDAHFVQVLVDDHSWAEHLYDPLYKVSICCCC